MLAEHHSFKCPGGFSQHSFTSGFMGREGSGSKDIWSSCNSPTNEKPQQNPSGEERCNAAPPPGARTRGHQPTKDGKNE